MLIDDGYKNDHTYVQELNSDRTCEDNHVTILHSDITPQQIQTVNVLNSMERMKATDTGNISVQTNTATENSQNGLEHSKQGQPPSSIRTHTGKQFHLCSVCNKAFSNSQVFKQHVQRHNESTSVHCGVCNRKVGKRSLNAHVKRAHTGGGKHVCTLCTKMFTSKTSLESHLLNHGGPPFKCSRCLKTFINRWLLRRHVQTHGAPKYECPVCKKRFLDKSSRNRHLLLHEKDKKYQCKVCGKKFRWSSDLRKHSWVHSQQKPHVCNVCNKGFIDPKCLRTHLLKHQQVKEFIDKKLESKDKITSGDIITYHKSLRKSSESTSKALEIPITIDQGAPGVTSTEVWIVDNDGGGQADIHQINLPSTTDIGGIDENLLKLILPELTHSDTIYVVNEGTSEEPVIMYDQIPQDTYEDQSCSSIDEISQFVSQRTIPETQSGDRHIFAQSAHEHNVVENANEQILVQSVEGPILVQSAEEQTLIQISDEQILAQNADDQILVEITDDQIVVETEQETVTSNDVTKRPKSKSKTNKGSASAPFRCNVCHKQYASKRNLSRHFLAHTGERPHKCTHCGDTFRQIDTLRSHIFAKHNEGKRRHQCPHCPESFPRPVTLQEHIWSSHKCSNCEKVFPTRDQLREHHKDSPCGELDGVNALRCDVCGKEFISKYGFEQHSLTHKFPNSRRCNTCGKRCLNQEMLDQHLKTQHHEKYHCDICGLKFYHKSKYDRHVNNGIHKPFHCTECDSTFAEEARLDLHKKVHDDIVNDDGEHYFLCSLCDKKFEKKDAFEKHLMRVHYNSRHPSDHKTNSHTEKSFLCTVCDKKFRKMDQLRKHLTVHTDNKPGGGNVFQCPLCGRKLSCKKQLNEHLKEHEEETMSRI